MLRRDRVIALTLQAPPSTDRCDRFLAGSPSFFAGGELAVKLPEKRKILSQPTNATPILTSAIWRNTN